MFPLNLGRSDHTLLAKIAACMALSTCRLWKEGIELGFRGSILQQAVPALFVQPNLAYPTPRRVPEGRERERPGTEARAWALRFAR
ncbi:hypothetical protein GGTG_04284 [Gaeumannomyces tritici R3-111a-1]|uniref:Uncharacterized protein n=1 Tax=Gaeumannomyces tritici (strain R3-111a-1) TaxID=644352 RepID=J3NSN4_GAET3|nr:hypothetical protein GGTG_04284 [Gaeumannomyces tritici R3-111a-1]EJT79197.1 hypothetical protein GGTG_04284 [Gaeumannomyces tritici R3-111a-1]